MQLAFSAPRARVLVFHTGRVVGTGYKPGFLTLTLTLTLTRSEEHLQTGCNGPMEARLSILRAQRQLAVEAGMRLHFRKFEIINQVQTHN